MYSALRYPTDPVRQIKRHAALTCGALSLLALAAALWALDGLPSAPEWVILAAESSASLSAILDADPATKTPGPAREDDNIDALRSWNAFQARTLWYPSPTDAAESTEATVTEIATVPHTMRLELLGIVAEGDTPTQAVIYDPDRNLLSTVAPGDAIESWTVESLSSSSAVMVAGDTRTTLSMTPAVAFGAGDSGAGGVR